MCYSCHTDEELRLRYNGHNPTQSKFVNDSTNFSPWHLKCGLWAADIPQVHHWAATWTQTTVVLYYPSTHGSSYTMLVLCMSTAFSNFHSKAGNPSSISVCLSFFPVVLQCHLFFSILLLLESQILPCSDVLPDRSKLPFFTSLSSWGLTGEARDWS